MTTKTGAFILIGSLTSAGLALLPPSTALAEDGVINVSANVVATCLVEGGGADLTFTNYNPGDLDPKDAATFFDFECTAETIVFVALDAGINNSGDQRRMVKDDDNTTHLNYALYQDAPGGILFGDDSTLGARKELSVLANTSTRVDVHGRIPQGEDVPTGDYIDTVNISIQF